jgi:hypothetical protein
MPTAEDVKMLFAEFPREAISWRAQSLTKDGEKAMALAYIDARDVMDRLDDICGADGWQDRYEFSGARTICYLSISIDGQWITKADGAGDTQVEAEKGAISDAFKRAAVKWGIGRYLYALDAPWVPCEVSEYGGKKHWKRWKGDPWDFVKQAGVKAPSSASLKRQLAEIDKELLDCGSILAVDKCALQWKQIALKDAWSKEYKQEAAAKFEAKRKQLAEAPDDFPGSTGIHNAAGRELSLAEAG